MEAYMLRGMIFVDHMNFEIALQHYCSNQNLTDYITVYSVLKSIGKLAVITAVKGQTIHKLKPHVDHCLILDDSFFCKCLRA
jgi:hypothetical protein